MAIITNNHKSPLGLPGGTVLDPGVKTSVHNWNAVKDNKVVAAWVKARILIVEAEAAPVAAHKAAVDDDKGAILAALAERGIKKDRRSSLESLKAALAEADEEEPEA